MRSKGHGMGSRAARSAWCVVAMCVLVPLCHSVVGWTRDMSLPVSDYAPLRPVVKPTEQRLSPKAPPGHVVLKFRNGLSVHTAKARLGGAPAAGVRKVFADYGLSDPQPMIAGDVAAIQQRRQVAEDRARMNLPDLSLYFRLPVDDPALAETLVRELNALDDVEIAFFEPRPYPATAPADFLAAHAGQSARPAGVGTTGNFESGQWYLDAAPGGVDARSAWSLPGGTGTGVQVIDVEYGWQLTHEDLSKGDSAIIIGVDYWDDTDHGTAVLGEMVSDRNGLGVTGIAHGADVGISSVLTLTTAEAITYAADSSDPGDCILIELHTPGPHYDFEPRDDQKGYVPMEYFQDEFDAMLYAWSLGVIVCEAAGNGAEDLDDPMYTSFFDTTFRNSHAIMCGAGNPPHANVDQDRARLSFSNYGERVNLQGYGMSVTTTGYGDLYFGEGSKNSWYTDSFSGTSSASPIVTGSVLCLSGVFKGLFGTVLDADSARSLLVATGSPQQLPMADRHIGPRPNLNAALGLLFDPVDSIWYESVDVYPGQAVAVPVVLANSHPVNQINLPFALTGTAPINSIVSVTLGPRTEYFERLHVSYQTLNPVSIAVTLQADFGGGSPLLPAGKGVVAYLWVTAKSTAVPGQVRSVDTATLGDSYLHLVSYFDDGVPNAFSAGAITIISNPCDCSHHGDLNGDGEFSIIDVVGTVGIAFRGDAPATTDPTCPHATRADYNCDGQIDVRDVVRAVGVAFRNGDPPCDPCQS